MKTKLKAATLMESLIAMVILVVCFGIASMIYTNVLNSDKQRLKLRAILLLDKETFRIKKEKKFIDSETLVGDISLKASFQKQEGTTDLYHFHFTASDKEGNLICLHDELVNISR